jgi:16S rRNA (adenine1518-N6/adenine1519-N6)-dimethyltransferase
VPRLTSVDRGRPRASARQRRLGQNFLADPNLLGTIVREADPSPDDVVLEIGGGAGALTERLSPAAARVVVVETDRRLEAELGPLAAELGNVEVVWGDAMKMDLSGISPAPTAMIANLPYSVATPVLLRTIEELPSVERWLVMVQREIAERLRAEPSTREYGAPSVLAQLACRVTLVRTVDPAVFVPRPRVESALLRLERTGPAPAEPVRRIVRGAFAHRRKSLARSLELTEPGRIERVRAALAEIGLDEGARAQELAPEDFAALARALGSGTAEGGGG